MAAEYSFEVVGFYIKQRGAFVAFLGQMGYQPMRMEKDTPLIDDISAFIAGLDTDIQKALQPQFSHLAGARWSAIAALRPLLNQVLARRHYSDDMDVTGAIMTKMELALEKAIDRVEGVNLGYIRQWLKASWAGAMAQDYLQNEDNQSGCRWTPRTQRTIFTDSYSEETDTAIAPVDEKQNPEEETVKNLGPNSGDCIRQALEEAEMHGERMVVNEAVRLLERCRTQRRIKLKKNDITYFKLRAYLLANGAIEAMQ